MRLAALPEEVVWALIAALPTDSGLIDRLFAGGLLRDGVVLASASLDAALSRAASGGRSLATTRPLVRYLIRAGTRPTPFGPFGTVNLVPISDEPLPLRLARETMRLSLFPDALSMRRKHLAKATDDIVDPQWVISPSVYRLAGTIRFNTVDPDDGGMHEVTVTETEPLTTVLGVAGSPCSGRALIDALRAADPSAPRQQLVDFLSRLAVEGMLVPSTVDQPVRFWCEEDEVAEHEIEIDPCDPDKTSIPARRQPWHAVAHRLSLDGAVDERVVAALLRAARVLRDFHGEPACPLNAFQRRFVERFEGRAVPLLEAVDAELGFGLAGEARHPVGTLLHRRAPNDDVAWGETPTTAAVTMGPAAGPFQLRLLERAWSSGDFHQQLDEQDLVGLPSVRAPWPSTMAGVVRLAGDGQICVDTVAGPSGMRMLSRFARSSGELRSLAAQESRYEMSQSPSAMHAELSFFPHERSANTVIRPCAFPHRIVFDGYWNPHSEYDIPVSDVALVVRDRRLRAIHGPSGREIVPHVSHTANQRRDRWPLAHRILALLESETSYESLRWSWGALSDARHLPRVSVGTAIVSRERWNLRVVSHEVDIDLVLRLQAELALPNEVELIAAGQPPFALRLEHATCAELLVDHLRTFGSAELVERWPRPGDSAVRSDRGGYAHELIIPLRTAGLGSLPPRRGEQVQTPMRSGTPPDHSDSSRCHPWLGFTIDCAPSLANDLITGTLGPLVASLRTRKLLHRWHYVRMTDPVFNLRFRMAVRDPGKLHELRDRTRATLGRLEASSILRYSEVPYERELHRYGDGIELAEEFFELDSNRAVRTLQILSPNMDEETLVFTAAMDCVTKTTAFADGDRQAAQATCEHLVRQFPRRSELGVDVSALYRRFTQLLGRIERHSAGEPWTSVVDLLERHGEHVRAHAALAAERGERDRKAVEPIASYVHMASNRLFRFATRAHEGVAYELACRHLHSLRLREAHNPASGGA